MGKYKKYKYGFVKAGTAVFDVKLGKVNENANTIIELLRNVYPEKYDLIVFPELCITGYSCQDRFFNSSVQENVENALTSIALQGSTCKNQLLVIGAPLRNNGKIYNCAVVMQGGDIIAVIPKTFLPNYNEYYEARWFASALDASKDTIDIGCKKDIPFGTDIIIQNDISGIKLACEICEDLWVQIPPSCMHAVMGANIIANPSASNEIIAKKAYRRDLVKMQSGRLNCAYVYSSAGSGESSSDLVYGGHQIIASCGTIVSEDSYLCGMQDEKHPDTGFVMGAVIDLDKIDNDRAKMNSFHGITKTGYRIIRTGERDYSDDPLLPDVINPYPFIPSDNSKKYERCMEILSLQASGLATRLKKSGIKKCIIGVSGGLDSTLALLVIKEAYTRLKMPLSDIIGVTMPGFGTTAQTKTSADELMECLGITKKTVDITKACLQQMYDIGHPYDLYDVTYENIQARERTKTLMNIANQESGLVVGTGDLSEAALGWCTFNADHISMYNVNASVPKTLVSFIVKSYAKYSAIKYSDNKLCDILNAICDTTISPELLPPDKDGNMQSTEQTIGKYDLHDFFLYHAIRNSFDYDKIFEMAKIAFRLFATEEEISKTLKIFTTRFDNSQWKRNCTPDGPKVGSVALSPRGDWRMPADFC